MWLLPLLLLGVWLQDRLHLVTMVTVGDDLQPDCLANCVAEVSAKLLRILSSFHSICSCVLFLVL